MQITSKQAERLVSIVLGKGDPGFLARYVAGNQIDTLEKAADWLEEHYSRLRTNLAWCEKQRAEQRSEPVSPRHDMGT